MDKASIDKLVNQRAKELLARQRSQDRENKLLETRALAIALSHKLRNRLGIIQTAIYNIKHKAENPQISSSINKIENSINESSQIIEGLTAFARIGMPKRRRTEIRELIEACLVDAQTAFAGWNVAIDRKYRDVKIGCVEADPEQLKEVFGNLLRNAYQSLPDKQGAIEIDARIDDLNREVAVVIKDNGGGIDSDNLAKIREPFFSTKPTNVGLGLTISYHIIDLHDGRIEVESAPRKGTKVTVWLPLKRNDEEKISPTAGTADQPREPDIFARYSEGVQPVRFLNIRIKDSVFL